MFCPDCSRSFPDPANTAEILETGRCLPCQKAYDESYLEEMANIERHREFTEIMAE